MIMAELARPVYASLENYSHHDKGSQQPPLSRLYNQGLPSSLFRPGSPNSATLNFNELTCVRTQEDGVAWHDSTFAILPFNEERLPCTPVAPPALHCHTFAIHERTCMGFKEHGIARVYGTATEIFNHKSLPRAVVSPASLHCMALDLNTL